MTYLNADYTILKTAGQPLHFGKITQRAVRDHTRPRRSRRSAGHLAAGRHLSRRYHLPCALLDRLVPTCYTLKRRSLWSANRFFTTIFTRFRQTELSPG